MGRRSESASRRGSVELPPMVLVKTSGGVAGKAFKKIKAGRDKDKDKDKDKEKGKEKEGGKWGSVGFGKHKSGGGTDGSSALMPPANMVKKGLWGSKR